MKALAWYAKANPKLRHCAITLNASARELEFPVIPIMDVLLELDPIFAANKQKTI